MLANGITLKYKKKTGTPNTFTLLEGLKEVPELGVDPEKVENTTLADKVKQYELGIGDAGELEYKFKYDNSKATSAYRVLRKLMMIKKLFLLNKLIQIQQRLNLMVKYLLSLAVVV